jgi:hypothetical protein
MKIFKELKKLGYKHYTEHTVEELDNLPLKSKERIVEQALVLRWFREKYKLFPNFHKNELTDKYRYDEIKNTETYEVLYDSMDYYFNVEFETYEEAESACIDKFIELVKEKINHEA